MQSSVTPSMWNRGVTNSLGPDEVQHSQGDAPEMVFRGFIGVPLYTHDELIGWSVTRVVNLSLRVQ